MTSLVQYEALMTAVEDDDVETVRALLRNGVSVNANLDNDIGTALHVAARFNSLQCVDFILSQNGVDVEPLATEHLQTPLMTSAAYGHVNVLQRLLAAGANINRQTASCSTALIVACHYGNIDCAYTLIDHGADPYIMNPWQYNALYMAIDTPEIMERLLSSAKLDVNERCGEREETALHLAAVIGSVKATQALFSAGADINARTVFNENALWLAIWRSHSELALLLIGQNIELDVPSNGCQVYVRHYLPLEVALGLQLYDVVRTLLLAGCITNNTKHFKSDDQGPLLEVPWIRLHSEAFDYIRNDREQFDWLLQCLRNPASLKDLCRRRVRRCLGAPLWPNVDRLRGLPRAVKDYLAMKNI